MEQRLIRSLMKPSAYPESTGSVQLVQTHVSFIFLTDVYAYKIKKPVDFGFLNFSTLDRRRFYCNEEVRLNRRLCPDIYLGVVEVRETTEGAAFQGNGKVMDYAVKMKRLPEDRMLDRLLAEDKLTAEDIRKIARKIGDFHLHAERGDKLDSFGEMETIRHNWEENLRQIDSYIDVTLKKNDLDCITSWGERFMLDNAQSFAKRVVDGFIRDCDGDIHMENISLGTDGNVCIFDCVEFNDRFRYGDTAADIAFLLMDFDYHGRPDFSDVLLAEYEDATRDTGVRQVLDFYLVYRAIIRGKVESMRLSDPLIPEREREEARDKAIRYFRLARGYILRKQLPPSLIIVCGLTGTGKSFTARELAFELRVEILNSDVVRKKLAGIPLTAPRQEEHDKGIYSIEFNALTYDELLSHAKISLMAGKSVIVDATFRRKADRARFRQLANYLDAPCHIILTSCPESLVKERLRARQLQPGAVSDGRWEIFEQQQKEFEQIGQEEGNLIVIDTSHDPSRIVDAILVGMGILPCG